MISQLAFLVVLTAGAWLFTANVRKIRRNILLGRDLDRTDRRSERWLTMARVALGQSKMVARPVAGILHILVYAGFIIINIEVLEILIDGLFGTHRVFSFMGPFYDLLIGSFEVLALLVIVACVVFLLRRNLIRLKRFHQAEMTSWPRSDANIILVTEIVLMSLFLTMNAADYLLQQAGSAHYTAAGAFPVSQWITGWLPANESTLAGIERFCWWGHIIGILGFLNYIPYSKHFHVFLSFPNTWYTNLEPKGGFTSPEDIAREVKLMVDPSAPQPEGESAPPGKFGASDVQDLTWKQLMDAYSCTECGRCTSACPANITGKKLSPRKIMMDTRDRLEAVGKNIDRNGTFKDDGKSLLGDHISPEELWACTTCNACVDACPVLIDPLSIIVDLRRHLVMEQSSAPTELNGMFSRIENNGAPWAYNQADRMKWVEMSGSGGGGGSGSGSGSGSQ